MYVWNLDREYIYIPLIGEGHNYCKHKRERTDNNCHKKRERIEDAKFLISKSRVPIRREHYSCQKGSIRCVLFLGPISIPSSSSSSLAMTIDKRSCEMFETNWHQLKWKPPRWDPVQEKMGSVGPTAHPALQWDDVTMFPCAASCGPPLARFLVPCSDTTIGAAHLASPALFYQKRPSWDFISFLFFFWDGKIQSILDVGCSLEFPIYNLSYKSIIFITKLKTDSRDNEILV